MIADLLQMSQTVLADDDDTQYAQHGEGDSGGDTLGSEKFRGPFHKMYPFLPLTRTRITRVG